MPTSSKSNHGMNVNQDVLFTTALKALGAKNIPRDPEGKIRVFQDLLGLTVDGDPGQDTKKALGKVLNISASAGDDERKAAIKEIKAEITQHMERSAPRIAVDSVGRDEPSGGFNFFKPSTWGKTVELKTKEKVSDFTGKYVGTSIPKGTFENPTPLELGIMKFEGFTPKHSKDGKNSASSCSGYGYYHPVKGTITEEKGFVLMQRQLQEKIDASRKEFGPNFDKLPKHKQDALLMLAYNIDIANPHKAVDIKNAIRHGDFEAAGDLFEQYSRSRVVVSGGRHHKHGHVELKHNAGLERRRDIESEIYNGNFDSAFTDMKRWHGMTNEQYNKCVAYYSDGSSTSRTAQTARGNDSLPDSHRPSTPDVYASNSQTSAAIRR